MRTIDPHLATATDGPRASRSRVTGWRQLAVQMSIASTLLATWPAWIQPAHAAAKPAKVTAAATEAAEELALQARARFQAKDFVVAAKLFMEAYAKDPKPALVFNAARAYEEAGMYGDAAGLFRLFVSICPDPEGVAKANERLRALEAKTSPVPAAAPAPAGEPARAGVAAPVGVRETIAPRSTVAEPAWPRWTATGAAAVCVVTGLALMAVARVDSFDAAKLPTTNEAEIGVYNTRFDSAERLWAAGLGVTVVGAGLGAWATWLHLRAGPQKTAWQLHVGPQQAQLTMRF